MIPRSVLLLAVPLCLFSGGCRQVKGIQFRGQVIHVGMTANELEQKLGRPKSRHTRKHQSRSLGRFEETKWIYQDPTEALAVDLDGDRIRDLAHQRIQPPPTPPPPQPAFTPPPAPAPRRTASRPFIGRWADRLSDGSDQIWEWRLDGTFESRLKILGTSRYRWRESDMLLILENQYNTSQYKWEVSPDGQRLTLTPIYFPNDGRVVAGKKVVLRRT